MIFTRSEVGLRNEKVFYGVDLIVYTEGSEENILKFDKPYYECLIKTLTKVNKILVKPIGDCNSVIDMHDQIRNDSGNNSFCIIDKDYSGVNYSIKNKEKLITTYGYSWENEVWSELLILRVIDALSAGNISLLRNDFPVFIKKVMDTAAKICRLDMVAQLYDSCILNKNNRDTFGVNLSYNRSEDTLLPKAEYKRLRWKMNLDMLLNCELSKEIYKNSLKNEAVSIVNGHFWESLSIRIIKQGLLEIINMNSRVDFGIMKNLAYGFFKQDPITFLSENVLMHYRYEFNRMNLI